MASLKSAFRFIQASFTLAFKKAQLQEQWVYIAVGNLIIFLIWYLPLALTVGLIGFRPIGLALIGLIIVFMFFCYYLWGEITSEHASLMMANLFEESALEGDELKQKPPLFERWPDILISSLVIPLLRFENSGTRLFLEEKGVEYPWVDFHVLLIPIISLENLGFKEAASRIKEIMSDHLLRFKPGFVKVDLLAKLVHWMMSIIGILTGISVGAAIADPFTTNPWQRVIALGIGLIISWLFSTLGHLFSAFVRSFYHTALYQWAMNVAAAREAGDPAKAVAPEILQLALGQSVKNKK